MQKLNVLLALREKQANRYAQMVSDYTSFFKNKQGAFQGTLKTHEPREGFTQDTTKVANVKVVTTVEEKMNWWLKEALEYINNTLSIELSNGQNAPMVPLVFEGVEYGPFPATVLLRLRGLIENDKLHAMFNAIPVREESKRWTRSKAEDYKDREIFETPLQEGVTRTTESYEEILKDPNLDPSHLPANYRAQTTTVKKTIETGDYTMQDFTGAWTHEQRAKLLQRRSSLLDAINVALQAVNDRDAAKLDVTELYKHLIFGK